MWALIIFSAFWEISTSVAEKSPDCGYCKDYDRLCPIVKDPKYLDYVLANLPWVADASEVRDTAKEFTCFNPEFLFLCPLSCGNCSPCSSSPGSKKIDFIPIQSVSAPQGKLAGARDVEVAIDGEEEMSTDTVFVSSLIKTDKPKFVAHIPLSLVESIGVKGEFSADASFKVCLNDDCTSCDKIQAYVKNHMSEVEWLKSDCPRGTKGNRVSINQSKVEQAYVAICEMNVTGTVLDDQ